MATPIITHSKVSSGTQNVNAEVDLYDWNQNHVVTGLENVPNLDTTNADNITGGAQTGTGAMVRATAPTITLGNATGLPVATGITGLASGVSTFLATPSSANLAAAMTDETGTGANVFANSPALTGTPTAPTAAVGTNTTQLASTAFVTTAVTGGNTFQQADRVSASFLTLSSGVVTDIISFSLPAGNWLVWGNVVFAAQGTTAYSETHVSISTASGTLDTSPGSANAEHVTYITGQSAIKPTAPKHLVLGSTTTVYLTATHTLTSGSAMLAYGSIFALPVGA